MFQDSVVVPVESQHFEFFDPCKCDSFSMTLSLTLVSDLTTDPFCSAAPDDVPGIAIKNLRKSRIYTEDWLGLKELDASGRLIFMEVQGDHLEFNANWCSLILKLPKAMTFFIIKNRRFDASGSSKKWS